MRRSTRWGRKCSWQVALLLAMLAGSSCGRGQAPASVPATSPPPPKAETRPTTAPGVDANIAATIQAVLSSAQHPSLKWGRIPDVAPVLHTLYAGEPDGLFWFDHGAPVTSLKPTLAAVAAAAAHGLDPEDYDATLLTEQFTTLGSKPMVGADLALFDVGVSTAVVRMLKAVHKGRVDPATMYWGYDNSVKTLDLPMLLTKVRDQDGLTATLDAVAPQVSHYGRAKRVLAVYQARAQAGEPSPVPALPKDRSKIQPGESWEAIPVLAKRLQVFGDLAMGVTVDGPEYSMPLVDAVKSFQRRHGLTSDGVIGAGTLRAVNVPLAKRVRQIELAMERMRWLPTLSDKPNVFVNVALFRLWATDPTTGDDPLRMNVVVGESLNHQTPLFVEKMEYVIFRPYWNPPQSVIVKELVPKARRDPSFLEKEGMEIVASGDEKATPLPPTPENLSKVVAGRLRLRQKPGPKNALGLAKFIFPNDEDVYMHGTPSPQLFSRARRDFSHGCIRLENPAKFAEWVLRDQPMWTREKIEAAMQGDKPTRVNLKQPLTVVLFYDTVHVNSEGVLFFMDDIYGHDQALDAALMRGYPYPSKGEVAPKRTAEEEAAP